MHAGSVTFKSRSIHNFLIFRECSANAVSSFSTCAVCTASRRPRDPFVQDLRCDFHSKLRSLAATFSRVTDQFVCPCSAASPTAGAPPNALSEPRKKNTATRHVFAILVLDERYSFSKTGHRLTGYQPGHVTRVSMCHSSLCCKARSSKGMFSHLS